MGYLLAQERLRRGAVGLAVLLAAAGLILWPGEAAQAVRDGAALCGGVILPALFPFFLLSSLIIELGLAGWLGRLLGPVMIPLFRVNGSCAAALALGVVGGYPVGARTAIQLYQSGQCSRTEVERLLAFCNNCGPAFILGVVGSGIFGSGAAGLLLYAAHLLASLLVGLIFRFYRPGDRPQKGAAIPPGFRAVRFSRAFTGAVAGALQGCLNISAFVLCFSVLIRLLTLSGLLGAASSLLAALFAPLGLDQVRAGRLLIGMLELSSGVSSLSGGPAAGRLPMAAFMMGWAGLSVHCQVLAFLGDSGLSLRTYLTGKLLHGVLSALLAVLLAHCFPNAVPACLPLYEQTQPTVCLGFWQILSLSAGSAWLLWLIFLSSAALGQKMLSKHRKKSVEKPNCLRYNDSK